MGYQHVPSSLPLPGSFHAHTGKNKTIPFIITIVSMYVVYVGPYLVPPGEIRPVCAYVNAVIAIMGLHIILLTFLICSKILFTCTCTVYRIIIYLSLLFFLFCMCTLMVVCAVPDWEVVGYGWEIGVLILLVAGISTAQTRCFLVLIVLVGQFQWFPNIRGTPEVHIWTKLFITAAQLPLVVVVFGWRNKPARTIPCVIMTVGMLVVIYANDRLLLAATESYTMYAVLAIRVVSVLLYIKQLTPRNIDPDIESMFFVLVIVFVPLILNQLPKRCMGKCGCKRVCCLTSVIM
jgi:hypothetical protein